MVLTRAWEQRYSELEAMVADLCASMKQTNQTRGSDHFERSGEYRRFGGDDRRFGGGQFRDGADDDDETYGISAEFRDYLMLRNDDDDETWTWTEHYSVMDDETDLLEEESMPQFQVPVSDLEHGLRIHNASSIVCEDSQYVVGCVELCDHQKSILQVSYVKEVEELPQKSTSGNGEHVAHQLFDQKPVRVTHKEKHMKHLKAWKFKFKPTSKRSKLMDDMFSFVEETALLKKDPKETIWNCVKKEFKETMAACGKTRMDRFKLIEEIGSSATNNVQVTEWIHEEESEKERKWKDVKHSGSLQSYYDDQVKSTELVMRDQTQEIISYVVSLPWVSVKRDGAVETQTCISRRANHVWKPGELEQVMVIDDVVSLGKHVKLSDCVALPLITPSSSVLQVFSHANRSVWEPGGSHCVQVQENRVQHERNKAEGVEFFVQRIDVASEMENQTVTAVVVYDKRSDRVWEPGGLPTKLNMWDWTEKHPRQGDVFEFEADLLEEIIQQDENPERHSFLQSENFQPFHQNQVFDKLEVFESKSSTNPMLGSMLKRHHKRQQVKKLRLSPKPWLFKFKQKLIRLKIRDKEFQIAIPLVPKILKVHHMLNSLVIVEAAAPIYPTVEYLSQFSSKVGIDKEHSSSSLRANQIWDPGGKFLYI